MRTRSASRSCRIGSPRPDDLIVLAVIAIGEDVVYDVTQREHALLRNFPVVGHFRYLFGYEPSCGGKSLADRLAIEALMARQPMTVPAVAAV